jgi:hypothetical protein
MNYSCFLLLFLFSCNPSNDLLKRWSLYGKSQNGQYIKTTSNYSLTFTNDIVLIEDSLGTSEYKWSLTNNNLIINNSAHYKVIKLDKSTLFLQQDSTALYFHSLK